MSSAATSTQILFIDALVQDIDSLLSTIDPSIEVILLDDQQDGLTQIANALAGRGDINAVHVISHGGPGSLQLGNGEITEATLAGQAEQLAQIRAALSDSADLMLYGCNVADGTNGASFIQALANATGADVAASTDLTGSALLGGDWTLEASTGAIEAPAIEVATYDALLGADGSIPGGLTGSGPWSWGGYNFQSKFDGEITDSDPENPMRAGNKWDRYALSGVTAGTTVYVYMGNSSTVDDFLQIDRNGTIVTQDDDRGDGERSYDAFVSWTYQVGDVIRATTFSSGYRGTYSLWIGTSNPSSPPVPTDIGSAPPPAPPAPTAPTFSDGITSLSPYADTGATDTASGLGTRSGTFTATDTTPTGTLTYSGGGSGTYGTLGVASGGGFTYTPNASVINALAAGANVSDSFTVTVSDGGLSSNKSVTVSVTGANDAPALNANASLPAVLEDTLATGDANPGRTVSALFGGAFSDVDNGASLGGIVIVGNSANASTEGSWQYSIDDGGTWHDVGSVSTSSGLALSAGSKLHFVPVGNYSGTPGSLTVHGTDNSFIGSYTSGVSRVTFDTTTDAATSGVSDAARTLGTSVTAVNDAPVFTSIPGAATLTETDAADASVTTASGSLSGTLTASDVDDVSGLSFSIRGGSGTDTVTKAGFYGNLTLNASSGAWTFVPTNFTAINALAQGASVTETFEFKAIDAHGAASTQNLEIRFTGTNDAPVLSHAIADQTFNGAGNWTYQLPADAFHDAEGLGLTYTVEVLNSNRDVIDTIGDTTGGNASLPSNWLIFDKTSHTFSGTPTATAPLPLTLRVIATDPSGSSVSDTFDLTLNRPVSDANTVVNAAPVSTHDTLSVAVGAVQALIITDFGSYADAEGSPLASVKITTLPTNGTFEYSADGSAWSAVTTNQVISRADIDAGHLRITAGTNASLIGFQVSDGTAYSSTYQLAVSPTSASGGVALADSAVHTAIADTWTSVYSGTPLTGFASTVRVVIDATGGTIKLASVPASVTANFTGYGNATDGTATSLAIEGTQADVNAALQLLQANRGSNPGVSLQISAIPGGSAYNPDNGHYYQVVGDGTTNYTWSTAKTTAEAMSFNGLQGYLATVTSAAENAFILSKVPADAWIGASDAASDGVWKWVTGPEAGTVFSNGNGNPVTVSGQYANWANFEPNGINGTEDYAEFYASGTGFGAGKWNDLNGSGLNYFIVEYGGTGSDPVVQQASRSITLQAAEPALSIAGSAAYTENAAPTVLNPALALTDLDNAALSSATVTLSAGKVAGDTLAFSNTNSTTFGNILATYDANTGALSLSSASASASLAQWQAALKAVTFSSTSDNPGNGARTVQWQVTDPSGNTSNTGTTSIAVTPVNDAPRASNLSDMPLAAGTDLNLDVSNTFTDPEGQVITYSATLADGPSLPSWLHFDPATHLLTGTPPAGTPSVDVSIVGTDASGAVSATTFTINLANEDLGAAAANNVGEIAISGTANSIGATLTAAAPVDDDGRTTAPAVVYQWQVSSNGSTWSDVSDGRGTGDTFTITQAESSKQIRVQSFYTDDGGNAEAPVSNVVTASAFNVSGAVSINGAFTPGQTLVASLSDSNGLLHANPSYQWYRGDTSGFTPGAGNLISGATYNTFTLTNTDGGKYLKVVVTYTDDEGGIEVVSDVSGQVQLGAVAPVAVNDVGAITEAGGLLNASGSTAPVTGNIRTNDTDQNNNISSTPIESLRSGGVEGVGEIATDGGTTFSVSGRYGTLTVTKATGAYSYSLTQDNASVEALAPGQTLQDVFNYTVIDNTNLTDNGLVTITINGADDEMTIQGLPSAPLDFSEDLAAELAATFMLVDPDSASSAVALRFEVSEGTLRASSNPTLGVTVTGSDTGLMIASGTSLAGLQNWLSAGGIYFRSAPNDNDSAGTPAATIALSLDSSANLADPAQNVYVASGSITVNLAAVNDAPIVDLGGSGSTGNDFVTTFRPRGSAVAVVSDTVTITDIDSANLQSATVTLASGADDNQFGTTFETLFSNYSGSLTLTGNGTGTNGLTDATALTFTGSASPADYQTALRSVFYLNANPNAAAGNRSITVSLSDGALASNLASFATASANTDIAVGQRIYIGGEDSGQTVAAVGADHTHFVASGPIPGLASNSALTFYGAEGSLVTSAIQTGPVVATTTVLVPWTPVIDMNGDVIDGSNHTVTFTEGGTAVALATADASITDQGGLIYTLTLTLTNPLDNAPGSVKEYLVAPSGAVATALTSRGITASGNGTGSSGLTGATEIVFTASPPTDATNFQIALRGVKYINTDDAPDTAQRIVTASTLDSNGLSGVGARTFINLTPTNDAPIGSAHTVSATEDTPYVFTTGDFPFSDATDGGANSLLTVKITTLPASGTLSLNGTPVTAGQTVLASDITAGHLVYTPVLDASGAGAASFTFQVQDNGGTAHGGVDLDPNPATLTINLAATNDAPLVTVPATIGVTEDVASALTGIVFADVDAASGSVVATLSVPGGTLAATSGSGVTVGGTASALTLTGTLAAINAFIAASGVSYTTASNATAPITLGVALNDGGNTGSGGNLSVSTSLTLEVTAVNDAPTITVPGTQTVAEEGTLAISGVSFGDVDAASGNVTVTLAVAHGTLTLDGDTSGVTVTAGSDGSAAMTLSGTLAAVNAAVASLGYVPDVNFSGTDSLQLGIDDGGNSGTGTALNATRSLTLTVTGANDAPVLTAGSPTLGVISDEDHTSSTGYAVQDFVGAGAGQTGVSDVDVPVDAEFAGRGVAIHTLDTSGAGTGTWEYQIGSGAWTAFTLQDGKSLLLEATDHIRFVPDGLNATTATFSYYLWDGASGNAGTQVDASTRGGSTAFSLGSDTATLTVTAVNDAPVVDLNGISPGNGGSAEFKPRGDAIQVIGANVTIIDPDSGDQITGATVTLDPDAIDNQFGTLYETLSSSYSGSLAVTGNGSGSSGLTGATEITFNGLASAAVYEAALQTITYTNSNPNAYAGVRNVFVTVHDDASTTTGVGATNSAVSTVQLAVNWSPVIDLNGSSVSDSNNDGTPDRNYHLSYLENSGAVAIAASDAFILDQDGNLKTVTVTLTNPLDGAAERLFVDASDSYLGSLGIAASVSPDEHTVTFSGNRDGTAFQYALRAVKYINTSDNPTSTTREITVESVDLSDHTGLAATAYINPVIINDAPTSANATLTFNEDTTHTFLVSDFPFSDVDANSLQSVRVSSLPAFGTLELDGVAVTAGNLPLDVSLANIADGLLTYVPNANANDTLSGGADSFGFRVVDDGGSANGGVPVSVASYTVTLHITPVNDLPVPNPPTVSVSGVAKVGETLTAALVASDVDFAGGVIPGSEYDVQWQSRSLPAGPWIPSATGTTYALTGTDANKEVRAVVVYHDTPADPITVDSDSPTAPLVVVAANGSLSIDVDGGTDPTHPVTITLPPGTTGPVTINNTGTTPITVTGLVAPTTVTGLVAPTTLSTSGDGPLIIDHPTGDVDITNTGTGTVTVADPNDGSVITVDGTGPVTVSNPAGDLTVDNTGTGTTTVTGLGGTSTLSTTGSGPVTVTAPADGATIINSGAGDVTVTDPVGDLTVSNSGGGTTTVNGAAPGSTVTTSGPVTLANPDGDLTLAGSGTNTVTGPVDGAHLTNNGTGTTTVNGVTSTLNTAGTGTTDVNAPANGAVITDTGSGPLSVTNPVGNLTVNNGGGGTASVTGAADGSTVTTSGDVTLANPDGNLTLAGTGNNTVTGLGGTSTLTTTGSGPTTVTAPATGATVANNGTGTTTVNGATGTLNTAGTGTTDINGPADGTVITDTGSGPLSVTNPVGNLTVSNGGGGTASINGAADGSTITTHGPITLANPDGDLTLAGDGTNTVTGLDGALTTSGTGPTTVTAPLSGAAVSNTGSGNVSIVDPANLTIDNHGSTPISVSSAADDAVLSLVGMGPTTISAPDGDLTVANTGTGVANVSGLADGSTLSLSGTGPVAVATNLPAGESITLDTSANGNVTLSNTGAGEIHVLGNLALDAADPMSIVLQGDHTTAITLAGAVALDNTPLNLSLAAGYNPALSDSITLIDNDGTDPVVGTFAGLAEGATTLVGGETFRITYRGGDGNNVMLTRVNANPGGAVSISGTPIQNATLTASNTLVDADGLGTVTYKWMDGSTVLGTGDSYTLKPTDVDHNIRAEATYVDGEGTTQTVASAPTSAIINVNDAPTGTVSIGGTAEQGQTLNVSNTLADLDGMGTISYQWLADGNAITGATGNTFLLGSAQVGKLITVSAGYTDGHGTAESVTSGATGIVNTVSSVGESAAPAGTTGTTGDGNGDGIADANQVAVVSTPVSVAGAANAGYVTLVADSNHGQVASGSTTVITDFVQSAAPDTLPLNGSAPLGSIGFTAETGTVSGLETFSLYVDPTLGVNGYWVQASNGNLVNLASEAYGGTMVVEGDKLRLDFQVQDGSIFDHDGSADGSVQLDGAIGYVPMGLITYAPNTSVPDANAPVWD